MIIIPAPGILYSNGLKMTSGHRFPEDSICGAGKTEPGPFCGSSVHLHCTLYIYIYTLIHAYTYIYIITYIYKYIHSYMYTYCCCTHILEDLVFRVWTVWWRMFGRCFPCWMGSQQSCAGVSQNFKARWNMDERFMVWWTLRGERLLKPAACTSCVARGLLANDKGVSLFFKKIRHLVREEQIWKVVSFLLSASWMQDFSTSVFFDGIY